MSLFIDEVVEENTKLKEEIKKLNKKYEILLEEWNKLIDEKVLYRSLFKKYKKAIEILKRELKFAFADETQKIIIDDSVSWDMLNISLKKKEYKLLKEMFGDE